MLNSTNDPEISSLGLIQPQLVVEPEQWFSDEITYIFQWITFSTLCQAVSIFGIGSNIINIICFVKQGFNDPVNVSFLGLAVADLGSLVPLIWTNLSISLAFAETDLPFEPVEVQHLISCMIHFTFTRISSWITALITLERCLCIIVPLKVKSIVTPKRVCGIIICVFVMLMASASPIYFVNKLGLKFFPDKNKTLIGMVFMGDRDKVESVAYIINNVSIPFGAFIIIIVCTSILVIQLHKKTKWRKASTVSTQADNVSTRNEKVAKMVLMISVLFIFCFTPMCAIFIVMSVLPGISVTGKQKNLLFIFVGFSMLLESVNSSMNIFIYYDMSSKYRTVLRQVLCRSQNKQKYPLLQSALFNYFENSGKTRVT